MTRLTLVAIVLGIVGLSLSAIVVWQARRVPECIESRQANIGDGGVAPVVKNWVPRPAVDHDWLRLEGGWVHASEVDSPSVLTFRGKKYCLSLFDVWVDRIVGREVTLKGYDTLDHLCDVCQDCANVQCGCAACEAEAAAEAAARGDQTGAVADETKREDELLVAARAPYKGYVPAELQSMIDELEIAQEQLREADAAEQQAQQTLDEAVVATKQALATYRRARAALQDYDDLTTRTVVLAVEVRFPDAVWKRLENRARKKGLTLHAALRTAVVAWLKSAA